MPRRSCRLRAGATEPKSGKRSFGCREEKLRPGRARGHRAVGPARGQATLCRGMNATGNATASECSPVLFYVDGLWGPGQYARRSESAHKIVGLLLVVGVFGWMAYVFDLASLDRAFLASGLSLASAGLYLGLWVLIFAAPGHVADGRSWSFASRDLVQQQHLAISSLCMGGGILEVLWAMFPPGGPPSRRWLSFRAPGWHLLWMVDVCLVGSLFLTHPQHSPGGSVVHSFLGVSLIIAGVMLGASKLRGFPRGGSDVSLPLAGVAQICAIGLLLFFREESQPVHAGVYVWCSGMWPVTLFAHSFAGFNLVLVVGAVLNNRTRCFTRIEGVCCRALFSCATAAATACSTAIRALCLCGLCRDSAQAARGTPKRAYEPVELDGSSRS